MIRLSTYPSPIGMLTLAARDGALVGLWMENQKYFGTGFELASAACISSTETTDAILVRACDWLDSYFNGRKPSPTLLTLTPTGTAFQRSVWFLLCEIPYGQLSSYGELACKLRTSPRAVGNAVGHNPISIIIPCHRVVGADGRLTGYAGGLERKRWLLTHEAAMVSMF